MNRLSQSPALFPVGPAETRRSAGRSLWLVTFVDLTALLIAFLVMLFAMSELDRERWQAVTESMAPPREAPPPKATIVRSRAAEGLEVVGGRPGIDLDYLAGVLRQGLASARGIGASAVLRRDDRLLISLPAGLLFAPGSTSVERDGEAAIAVLSDILGNIENRIEIVGHADPTPPQAGFASNWELSLARALTVAGRIERAGYARPIVVRGLGDSRYAALPEALPEARRLSLARRVDIVIHKNIGEPER